MSKDRLPPLPKSTRDPEWEREAAALMQHIFERADDDAFIERRLLQDGPARSLFIRVREARANGWDIKSPAHLDGKFHIFFGVLPRYYTIENTRQRDGSYKPENTLRGSNDHTRVSYVTFVDCDKGIPDPWPAGIPLPTAVVQTSTGKAHLYWRLKEPITDLPTMQALNKRLARALNGDAGVHDFARILRIPGFLNIKSNYGPDFPRARLLSIEDRFVTFEELSASVPIITEDTHVSPSTQSTFIPSALPDGTFRPERIGQKARHFREHGAALNTGVAQDVVARDVALNLVGSGMSEADAIAWVWEGLQKSPLGRLNDPWTYNHAVTKVQRARDALAQGKIRQRVYERVPHAADEPGMAAKAVSDHAQPSRTLLRAVVPSDALINGVDGVTDLPDPLIPDPRPTDLPPEVMAAHVEQEYGKTDPSRLPFWERPADADEFLAGLTPEDVSELGCMNLSMGSEAATTNIHTTPMVQLGLMPGASEEWVSARAKYLFPVPVDVKPQVISRLLRHKSRRNEVVRKPVFSTSYSNPYNKTVQIQLLYQNFGPIFVEEEQLYTMEVPAEDFDKNARQKYTQRVKRRGGQAVWFDNVAARRTWVFFCNREIEGVTPVSTTSAEDALVLTLNSLVVPPDIGRRTPHFYSSTRGWAMKREKTESDYQVIGTRESEPDEEHELAMAAKFGMKITTFVQEELPLTQALPLRLYQLSTERIAELSKDDPEAAAHEVISFVQKCGYRLSRVGYKELYNKEPQWYEELKAMNEARKNKRRAS